MATVKAKHLAILAGAIGYLLLIAGVIKYEAGVAADSIKGISCKPTIEDTK